MRLMFFKNVLFESIILKKVFLVGTISEMSFFKMYMFFKQAILKTYFENVFFLLFEKAILKIHFYMEQFLKIIFCKCIF